MLDVVGLQGLDFEPTNPVAVLDGRDGARLFEVGRHAYPTFVFCPSARWFAATQLGALSVVFRSARDPEREHRILLSDTRAAAKARAPVPAAGTALGRCSNNPCLTPGPW